MLGFLAAFAATAFSGFVLLSAAAWSRFVSRRPVGKNPVLRGAAVTFVASGLLFLDAAVETRVGPTLFGYASYDANDWYDDWGIGIVIASLVAGFVTSLLARRAAAGHGPQGHDRPHSF